MAVSNVVIRSVVTVFVAIICAACAARAVAAQDQSAACKGKVYLAFESGNMAYADDIASLLQHHGMVATFFLTSQRTVDGGWSLDDQWAGYWRERVAEGHAFGTMTYDVAVVVAGPDISVRTTYGENAGKVVNWNAMQYCDELRRVDFRFRRMTGQPLDALWRAPESKTTAASRAAGERCGYGSPVLGKVHKVNFMDAAVAQGNTNAKFDSLAKRLKSGDVLFSTLDGQPGEGSSAPAIDRLISEAESRSLCFATLRDHPLHPQ
jgi:peptidoglycan/xylan/chitin deacetylase (PgdA/CDA1 family)